MTRTLVPVNTAALLAQAHACLMHAHHASLLGGADLALRCLDAALMLEDCGAAPSADLLAPDSTLSDGSTSALLEQAAAALDEVPASDRPEGLLAVRVEIAGALVGS